MKRDATETPEDRRLMSLTEMKNFRISKGEPDIRSWDVVTADQKRIGEVHDLIVDTSALKVRYLDVEIDPKILGIKKSSHVLIPIAGANLDDDDNRVYINRLTSSDIASIPAYDHRPLVRDYERHLLGIFGSENELPHELPASAPPAEMPEEMRGDFYADDRFSDRRFWGNRRRGRDEVDYLTPAGEAAPDDETLKRR